MTLKALAKTGLAKFQGFRSVEERDEFLKEKRRAELRYRRIAKGQRKERLSKLAKIKGKEAVYGKPKNVTQLPRQSFQQSYQSFNNTLNELAGIQPVRQPAVQVKQKKGKKPKALPPSPPKSMEQEAREQFGL